MGEGSFNLEDHFSSVSAAYGALRTTDPEPVNLIAERLQDLAWIVSADVGCGTGRYSLELYRRLKERLLLYCIDPNRAMLSALRAQILPHTDGTLWVLEGSAEALPLPAESLDCLCTFNAIHHFHLPGFLSEAARTLKEGGRLFIYTRFRSQNARTIWGRYFPGFLHKETRLYELGELAGLVEKNGSFVIEESRDLRFPRTQTLSRLEEQARQRHYSTFCFYESEEFNQALAGFTKNLLSRFPDPDQIQWVDENTLLVLRKR